MIRIFNQYVSPKSLLLVVLENVLIALSLISGAWIRFRNDSAEFQSYIKFPDFAYQILLVILVFQICFYYSSLYDFGRVRRSYQLVIGLGQSLGAASLLLGMMYYVFPGLLIGQGVFFIGIALTAGSVLLSRVVLDHAWQFAAQKECILILGDGELASKVARELSRREDLNIELAGFITRSGQHSGQMPDGPVLGAVNELASVVASHHVTRIIVALEDYRGVLPVRELVRLRVEGVRVEDAHSMISALNGRVWLCTVKPSWFVFSDGFHRSRSTMIVKRAMDIVFGVLGAICSLPAMILVAIAIPLESKGPIIYRQVRVGLRGKPFEVLKFRSMRVDAEQPGIAQWAKVNDPRVTRLGKFIRTFRLDELPQFWNVIRGDMSFVGPRPERPVFVDQLRQIISYYDERHSVRPGLTGWAQVQYPYGATVEDAARKLEYDLFYLKNLSVFFDCAIILQTIRTVFTGRGAR
jgi:sugar transferase (PEP-CTERM system associated)